MIFDFDEYSEKDMVMICKTKKEATQFCELLHNEGRKWSNGESYLSEDHFVPTNGVGYVFNCGMYSSAETFDRSWYKQRYKIYKFSQFDWSKYQSFEPDMVRMDSFLSEFRGVS